MTPAPAANNSLSSFFFDREVPYGLAIVRILLPLVLLLDMVPRWFHAREIYSLDGAAAPLQLNYGLPDMLPVPSGTVAVVMASILVFTLLTSCVGWMTRLSLAVTTGLYTYLTLMDCLSTMTKYTVIASHGMLLLSMSQCGSLWSVDSLLRRRRDQLAGGASSLDAPQEAFPAWPRRLMHLLTGLIYLGAAFTKMHTPAYFSSDQMRAWMLTNVNSANPVGEWLSYYPGSLMISAYMAILFEVLFVFLAWRGKSRICMLALGVMFHFGTLFLLGLYIFPLVCCSLYFAFFNERDAAHIGGWMIWLSHRGNPIATRASAVLGSVARWVPDVRPRTAAAAFVGATLLVAGAGLMAEHALDPFGIRNPNGKLQLAELDVEQVRQMLRISPRIRESDKYLAFDIGSELFGDLLVNHRESFKHGETLLAQCTLTPPHEDMWIECNLHDAENHIIDRVGQVIDRATLRSNYAFDMLPSLEPGTYFLVVKSAGQEITRRAFTLLPQ